MEAILTRRSIRAYTDRPVPGEMVTELLKAAMAAPSAANQQPWQFIVVRERRLLEAIAAAAPHAGMVRGAQVAVVVCGDLSVGKAPGFWVQDCSAAIENLLIAANSLGLGAVWLGFYPREDRVAAVRALFDLPEHIVPMSVISIGWPAEHPAPADRFDPARIHYDRW